VYCTATPLLSGQNLEDEEVMKISATVHKQGRTAMSACSYCADFITTKRPIIQEAETLQNESTAKIASLLPRIKLATRRTAEAFQKGKENRTIVSRRTAAKRVSNKLKAVFDKYNSAGDGIFTLKDVAAYAKGEFNFDIPEENLKRIESQLYPEGQAGLGFETFPMLKTAVGIARTEVKGRERLVEKKARKDFVDSRRVDIQKKIADLLALLDADAEHVREAESHAEILASEAGSLQADDLKERATIVQSVTEGTKKQIAAYRQMGLSIMNEVNVIPELEVEMKAELVALDARLARDEQRLTKATEMASSGRQLALYMAVSEYEGLWTEVVVKMRSFIEADGKGIEDLFNVIVGSEDESVQSVTPEAIHAFLARHDSDIELPKVRKLFCRKHTTPEPKVEVPQPDVVMEPKKEEPAEVAKEEKPDDDEVKDVKEEGKAEDAKKEGDAEGEKPKEEEVEEDDDEDDFISKDDLEKMTVPALKALCKQHQLTVSGLKGDLVERLHGVYGKKEEAKKKKEAAKNASEAGAKAEQDKAESEAKEKAEAEAKQKEEAEAKKKEEEAPKAVGIVPAKDDTAKEVSREEFNRIIRMYYKVARQCVLSDNLLIEKSAQIRRMEVGEVVEVHRGPCVDTSVNVFRLLGKAIRDGTVGWATIAGNQGITFLMPGGRIFTVKATVPFTNDKMDVDGSTSGVIRDLVVGEFLEVMEWVRTSKSALGVTRIQARAQNDGAVGWATVIGNDNTTFLEAMV